MLSIDQLRLPGRPADFRHGLLGPSGVSGFSFLVGAIINQRPELFGVAIPRVGVIDMLRFHKFNLGVEVDTR